MRYLILLLLLSYHFSFSQTYQQNLFGKVSDVHSKSPISFAIVNVNDGKINKTTKTNENGEYVIENLPIGRYTVSVSYLGYEKAEFKEVEIVTGREKEINFQLSESRKKIDVVLIRVKVQKEKPLNVMSIVSSKMLSMEEAKRYAGGFDDPARLVSSFAGVSGGTGTQSNAIVIRGNAPKSLQWKIEGVEIPNPNHFADNVSFGGGGVTALSSQVISNSDFISGAFSAEYTNALSGVFDIKMRIGSKRKRQHTFQVGLIGIDFGSEGPFIKGKTSSYVFNYRYSTLGLVKPVLPKDIDIPAYQDLSFKFNFPTKKAGTFSFWGIGLIDNSGAQAIKDSLKWKYDNDRKKVQIDQYMGAMGISHLIFFNPNTFLQSTLAYTTNSLNLFIERLGNDLTLTPSDSIKNKNNRLIFNSFINKKWSLKHTNKTGVCITGLYYDMLIQNTLSNQSSLNTIVDANGKSTLMAAYTSSQFNLNENVSLTMGLSTQHFLLNNKTSFEPRLGIRYNLNNKHSLSMGYGLHSRLEQINFYLVREFGNSGNYINNKLDFTKAHHIVFGYDININPNLHLKIEPYYQYLFKVPVISDSSFSFINMQNEWYISNKLSNKGNGRNYGVDFTLEKYMTEGIYYLFTLSLFDSKYKGGDDVWRNTLFNRNYLINILGGKEWKIGKAKNKVFGLNARLNLQGGQRYTSYDETKSLLTRSIVYNNANPYTQQTNPLFTVHFTTSYKINRPKITHEFALRILNATMVKDFDGFKYNYINNTIDKAGEALMIPNLSYKIEF